MKRLIIILSLFLIFINISEAVQTTKQDIKLPARDGFTLTATLEYPKVKGQKSYNTVVLLHSLGYSSQWWENLPKELLENGYAVLSIDLRGHGKSVYNPKLVRVSWQSLTNKAYAKYPDDVITIIDYIKNENKRVFFDNWAMVGADIGANTAVIAANKISYRPKTLVLLSPVTEAKGLYIPVKFAELGNMDILSISGANDMTGQRTQEYLKKFAQATFVDYISESQSTGMVMLKHDKGLVPFITGWINQYLK